MSQSKHIDFLSWLRSQKQLRTISDSFFFDTLAASVFFFFFPFLPKTMKLLLLALSRRVAQAPQAAAAATRFPFLEISRDFPDFHWLVFPFSLQVYNIAKKLAGFCRLSLAKMKTWHSICSEGRHSSHAGNSGLRYAFS